MTPCGKVSNVTREPQRESLGREREREREGEGERGREREGGERERARGRESAMETHAHTQRYRDTGKVTEKKSNNCDYLRKSFLCDSYIS